MRRIYLTLTTIVILSATVQAQQAAPQVFTLEQCIQYAIDNSPTRKNATLDEKIADARVKEIRGIGLPQIDGSVGLTHNQKLPRFFMQYNPDGPSFIDGSQIPGIQEGDVVAAQNFFQLKSGGNAAVSISQILFNGSYIAALQASDSYRDLAANTSQYTRENISEGVALAYYAVLINKDRIRLYDGNVSRIDSTLRTTKAMNENGFTERIDVDRIQVNANNLRATRNSFVNQQEMYLQLLKYQMHYPLDQPIEVAGDIATLQINENLLSEYLVNWDYTQRSDYQILQANRKLSELDVKNKFAESLPSLVAFANLGYMTQSPDIGGLFTTNSGVQDNGIVGPDKWYSFSSFGVNLNVPIFSGFQRTYKQQQAKLNLQKVENNVEDLRSGIDTQIKTAAIMYLNAINAYKSQLENLTLAKNVVRVTRIKYEQGVGSNIEVTDAEGSLEEAQTNYYNALYQGVVAKIALDKAYGKLSKYIPQENK